MVVVVEGIQHQVAVAATSCSVEACPAKMYVHLKPCLDKSLCNQAAVKLYWGSMGLGS